MAETNPPPILYAATLTVDQVKEYVAYIGTLVDKPDDAHGAEDGLYQDVLTAIAIGRLKGVDAQLAALVALRTEAFEFDRWTG
jgi:hypothetical protein